MIGEGHLDIGRRVSRREIEAQRSHTKNFQEGSRGALHRVRDQDRLDGASNFVVWKAGILSVLDRNRVKHFALRTIPIPVDPIDNNKYEDAMARAKSIILDGVKDHIVPHIVEKNTTQEMWEALTKLYQQTSVQRKMLLEN